MLSVVAVFFSGEKKKLFFFLSQNLCSLTAIKWLPKKKNHSKEEKRCPLFRLLHMNEECFHINPNTLSISINDAKIHLCLTDTGNVEETPSRNTMNFKTIFYEGNTKG